MTTTETIFPPLDTAEFVLLAMCTGEPGCAADYHQGSCPAWTRSRRDGCACRFPGVTEAGDSVVSAAWERQHAAFHLAVFPGARTDHRTVRNLRERVVELIGRERGCGYATRFGPRQPGTTKIDKTVYCLAHGDVITFGVDTAVHTWDDPGREPWTAHVLEGSAPL